MTIKAITTEKEILDLLSSNKSTWIFKHSATCGISMVAKEEVEKYISETNDTINMIVVQTHRSLSNLITEKTSVIHQSPQILLFENNELSWKASHYDITAKSMKEQSN